MQLLIKLDVKTKFQTLIKNKFLNHIHSHIRQIFILLYSNNKILANLLNY